jgi:hypothetical protein
VANLLAYRHLGCQVLSPLIVLFVYCFLRVELPRLFSARGRSHFQTSGAPGQRMSLLHFRCKERRRTQRVTLTVPISIHGHNEDGHKFCIHVKSNAVSQHGAQLETEHPLIVGQIVLVVNESSTRETEARVASIQRKRDGKTYVGVEFLSTEINFWSMTFPIPGAKPLRRALPKTTQTKVSA